MSILSIMRGQSARQADIDLDGPNTGTEAVDALIFAAHRVRTAADTTLRAHGLSFPSFKLLRTLVSADRAMREVSDLLHLSPRTITDMIDTLEARGLVSRQSHPSDRRITLLHLSEAGARHLADASFEAEHMARDAVSSLDEVEQQTLRSLLERVGGAGHAVAGPSGSSGVAAEGPLPAVAG
jgi:DNA-binding MarR family transcriptional regulator